MDRRDAIARVRADDARAARAQRRQQVVDANAAANAAAAEAFAAGMAAAHPSGKPPDAQPRPYADLPAPERRRQRRVEVQRLEARIEAAELARRAAAQVQVAHGDGANANSGAFDADKRGADDDGDDVALELPQLAAVRDFPRRVQPEVPDSWTTPLQLGGELTWFGRRYRWVGAAILEGAEGGDDGRRSWFLCPAVPLHVLSRCRSTRGATPTLGLCRPPLMALLSDYPTSPGISWLCYSMQSLRTMASASDGLWRAWMLTFTWEEGVDPQFTGTTEKVEQVGGEFVKLHVYKMIFAKKDVDQGALTSAHRIRATRRLLHLVETKKTFHGNQRRMI